MDILFGILITITVICAIVGMIATIVYENTGSIISGRIAWVCLIALAILGFATLLLAFNTSDPKVGTGR